ncbi:Coa1 protein [Scheffersomyces xylosifermentans]|uniref:Coa1 protein n=1 Tax=Scheffersomyces xylosifermentans TaxID=1304137 RepID=UPI00315C59DF
MLRSVGLLSRVGSPLVSNSTRICSVRLLQSSARAFNANVQSGQSTRVKTGDDDVKAPKIRPPVSIDRELPDPFVREKQNKRYFVVYAIGVTVACAIIFNYEKTMSPITTSTLYFLRRSDIAKENLGDGIDFKSSWPWISGTLNTVKGDIDISFNIKGDKGDGVLKLKATRESKLHPFDIHHFLLEVKDGEGKVVDYDLTKDSAIDFDI